MFKNTTRNGPKIVVFITVGKQTNEPGSASLVEAMRSLNEYNAKVFVVGVGKVPTVWELEPIVGRMHNIIFAPSFAELKERSNPIARYIRRNSGEIFPHLFCSRQVL